MADQLPSRPQEYATKMIGILIAVALISLAIKLGAYWTGWSASERQTLTVTEQRQTDRIRTLESA